MDSQNMVYLKPKEEEKGTMKNFETRLKSNDNTYKELFLRYPNNPILTAKDWPYAVNSVFNPAATEFDDKILLLARVEDRRGFSHFTKAVSEDGVTNWQIDKCPTLEANSDYPEEAWGIEDPRITRIDELNRWAVVYTSYSRSGPTVSLALTKDFVNFEKVGSIMPPEDKDAALFPRKFKNKWLLIHRPIGMPLGSVTQLGPGAHIWISCSSDLKRRLVGCQQGWTVRPALGNFGRLAHSVPWGEANRLGLHLPAWPCPAGFRKPAESFASG